MSLHVLVIVVCVSNWMMDGMASMGLNFVHGMMGQLVFILVKGLSVMVIVMMGGVIVMRVVIMSIVMGCLVVVRVMTLLMVHWGCVLCSGFGWLCRCRGCSCFLYSHIYGNLGIFCRSGSSCWGGGWLGIGFFLTGSKVLLPVVFVLGKVMI